MIEMMTSISTPSDYLQGEGLFPQSHAVGHPRVGVISRLFSSPFKTILPEHKAFPNSTIYNLATGRIGQKSNF